MTRISTALALALVASLALNVWLAQSSSDAPLPAPPTPREPTARHAPLPDDDDTKVMEPVEQIAQLVTHVSKASTHPRSVPGTDRVRGDAELFSDAQCRVARERAAESFRKDAEGIRRALQAPF